MFGLSVAGVLLFLLFFFSTVSVLYFSSLKEMTLESYFFANRRTHWFILSLSLLSGCLFGPYILGLSAMESGFSLVFFYTISSILMLILMGWIIAPFYLKEKINSVPEYFEKRFSPSCKLFLSVLYIFYNIFFRLLIILSIGNFLINNIAGVDAYSSILFFLILAGIYVIIGGLQAEIYVNVVQMSFLSFGVLLLFAWLIFKYGEVQTAFTKIISAPFTLSAENSDFTLPGLIFGIPVIGFWFWCADQFMVQKVLSARNLYTVHKASFASLFFQIVPMLIFIIPALLFFGFFHGLEPKEAFNSLFSAGIVPDSIQIWVLIAVAAGIMSSFASLYTSTSYIITFDFYRSFYPKAVDKKLILIARLTVIALLFFSILLIPFSQNITITLSIKLFYTLTYFAAMTAAVFITGLLTKKIDSTTVVITLSLETVFILLKTLKEVFYSDQDKSYFLSWIMQFRFLEFSLFVFVSTVISMIIINRIIAVQPMLGRLLKKFSLINIKLKFNKTGKIFYLVLIIVTAIIAGFYLFNIK